ncbi:ABC transporter ATP-binding protein [Megalodesulfovibrio gigas]|uniref:Putative ABC transporter ATP-binding protein n=1 Tax=Megalodesulfovibrio gigas (strain ATCC 19364 / DSM 1382 / NCIMB 9332 / VKM B-1759) TaxID=1121448 RepID=T2GDB9_MEGG1|nr:ABC transporter ATP-binding protein [Megalodesulfovibrio gigas]AGW14106.1 putative ABC transporter ATP-binding protein [Megalodesulfovibrio gigas DSM 1382 = ATCC 19364]
MIRCEGLACSHPGAQGRPVLQGVELHLRRGELVAVLGPNGSGKSTLLKAMAGLLPPLAGSMLLGGAPVHRLPPAVRARRVACLPQQLEAPAGCTVRDLVLMGRHPYASFWSGLTRADREAAVDAMLQADVLHLADRDAARLSGGELQRACIARTLCQQTPVLLLDEPTANLDLAHKAALLQVLQRRHAAGTTVVCVLHDINLAALYFHRLLFLKQGRLVLDGPPQQVMRQTALEFIYETPLVVMEHPLLGLPQVALAPGDVPAAARTVGPGSWRH